MNSSAIEERDAHVWIAAITPSESAVEEYGWDLLDTDERAAADRIRVARARLEYIAAHALVRTALSHHAPVDPKGWRFRRRAEGKPEIAGPAAEHGLHFNLSHTQGLAVCAVSRSEVGIDAENLSRPVNAIEIANQFFSADEARGLQALDGAERTIRFIELWTLKEAMSKGLGAGLRIALDRIEFEVEGSSVYPKYPRMKTSSDRFSVADWNCILIRPLPSHLVAIAMPRLRAATLQWQSIPFR